MYQDGRVLGVGSLHNTFHPRNAVVKIGYVSQAGVSDPELWFFYQNCGSLSLILRWTASLLHDLWVTLRVLMICYHKCLTICTLLEFWSLV